MNEDGLDLKICLTSEEVILFDAIFDYTQSLIKLGQDPISIAKATLVLSSMGFASFGSIEQFKELSKDLYLSVLKNIGELPEDEFYH